MSLEVEQQIRQLDDWIKTNPDSRELKRAIAVKLSLQGWAYRAIAPILNVSKGFISIHKSRFKERGIEGLKLAYKGAESFLTKSQKQQTLNWLQEKEFWDISELECYLIEEFDVVFKSSTSYYELLKEAKISWQKAQAKNPRKDEELVKKNNKEFQQVVEENKEGILNKTVVMYALDEVHLLEGDLISHLWGKITERLKIPLMNPKNRQTYYGALALLNSELIIEDYPAGNSENTVNFLKKLLEHNPNKRIILFWDGASYHKGKVMQEFLSKVNRDLEPKDWRITCCLFAPYAPEENPIEEVWLSLKTLLRRCYRFCKNFRIMKDIFELLVEFQLFNFPDLKNYDSFSCLI
ncbi:IS630 family transposase [Lusitaniella coriacea]|uniref:IS630 family transposase n=1 Tax=Lusitaniella coriacea TaxID=1983105 RepID=UPI003CEED5A4